MKLLKILGRMSGLSIVLGSLCLALAPAALGQEGNEINTPRLDLVVIVDESGSMWQETDLNRERIDAFNLLIDTLAFDRAAGDEVRINLIAFGSEAHEVIPFEEGAVNAQTVTTLKNKYLAFQEGLTLEGLGWTDIYQALQLAEQALLRGHRPDHKPVIMILSDGKPETVELNEGMPGFEQSIGPYIDQILQQAARFQSEPGGPFYYEGACEPLQKGWVPIYTIAVREGAVLPEIYQEIWLELARQNGGAYYADPAGLSLGQLGGRYYEIWTQLICRNSELELVTLPFRGEYEVNNLYQRIVFTILKETPNVEVRLYRPDGRQMSEGEPGSILNRSRLDEVWSISRSEPWSGTWIVELSGEGTVRFGRELFADTFEIKQLSPVSNFISACDPIELILQITNRAGVPIAENVQRFQLEVTAPDQPPTSVEVGPEGDVFRYRYDQTCADGEYHFSGLFQISDEGLLDEGSIIEEGWATTIRATLEPSLEIVSPRPDTTYYSDEAIPLAVDIKLGDEYDEATAARNPPVRAVIYQGANLMGEFQLAYSGVDSPARMVSEPPAALPAGHYRVEFNAQLAENQALQRQAVEFLVAPANAPPPPPAPPAPPAAVVEPPTPISPLLIAALLGSFALLAAVGGGWWWYRQSPALLPFSLTGPDGRFDIIGRKFGGRLAESRTFPTRNGETVQLQFSPGQDEEGQRATWATLLNDLAATPVRVDQLSLRAKGESALITGQSDTLMIDGDRYIISTY